MRKTKYDKNHGTIVSLLTQLGFTVQNTAMVGCGFPDLVVGALGRNYLVEVKTPDGTLQPSQTAFARDWNGGDVHVLRNADDCIAFRAMVEKEAKLRI